MTKVLRVIAQFDWSVFLVLEGLLLAAYFKGLLPLESLGVYTLGALSGCALAQIFIRLQRRWAKKGDVSSE